MLRRPVGDRQDGHGRFVSLVEGGEDDGARSVFVPVFPAFLVFGIPQAGVSDDQTRLRGRKRHCLFKFVVEMIVPRVHLGFGDLVQLGVRQVLCSQHVA